MSQIGKTVESFKASAYNAGNGEFIEVTEENLKGTMERCLLLPSRLYIRLPY